MKYNTNFSETKWGMCSVGGEMGPFPGQCSMMKDSGRKAVGGDGIHGIKQNETGDSAVVRTIVVSIHCYKSSNGLNAKLIAGRRETLDSLHDAKRREAGDGDSKVNAA